MTRTRAFTAAFAAMLGAVLVGPSSALATRSLTSSGSWVVTPAVVDVSSLPPVVLDPVAPPPLPALVPDPQVYAAAKAAAIAPAAVARERRARRSGPSLSVGQRLPSPLAANSSIRPPDMGLAAGGGKVLEMVNLRGQIWNGAGAAQPAFDLAQFFHAGSDSISDPWVVFDGAQGRFYAAIFDLSQASERIAVSRTSDPGGRWFVYDVSENGGCPDQGKLGFDDIVIAVSANRFTHCDGGAYLGDEITLLDKAPMLTGSATHVQRFGPDSSLVSAVPAVSSSGSTVLFFAAVDAASQTGSTLHLGTSIGVPPGAFVGFGDIAVPAYSIPPSAIEPDLHALDTGDSRVQNVILNGQQLVYGINTGCVPKGDVLVEPCARLTAIDTGSDRRLWSHTFGAKLDGTYYPAAAFNVTGDIGVALGRTGVSTNPELIGSAGTPGGSFAKAVRVQSGDAVNDQDRFGDYDAAAPDPVSGDGVWVAGEIGGHNPFGANGWGTAVGLLHILP